MTYLLQQPETLQNESIDAISIWIARQAPKLASPIAALRREADPAAAERALRQQILVIRNHFYYNLPKKFHDVVLSNTMTQLHSLLGQKDKFSVKDRKVIWRLTDAFYTDHLTSLSLPYIQNSLCALTSLSLPFADHIQNSLCVKSQMLTNLTRLEISCMHSYPQDFEFIQLLRPLRSLKHLTITKACTDDILRCMVTYCNLIEELDISSNFRVNNASTDILVKLPNLASINLRKTSVESQGIETILLTCQKIVKIESDVNLKHVLKDIAESDEKFPKHFKLSSYASFGDTLQELELVIRMCPLIQNLNIQQSRQYRVGGPTSQSDVLTAIREIRHLRQLKLTGFAFYQDKVNKSIQNIGSNLVQLYLGRCGELDKTAFVTLGEMCPNLQSISLIDCTFEEQPMPFYYEQKNPPFRNIKDVYFDTGSQFCMPRTWCSYTLYASHSLPKSDSSYIQEPAFFLLSNCINVESIEIRNLDWLTEDFMLRLLDKNPLTCLKVFRIDQKLSKAMTSLVVDKMAESCSSQPQIVLV